MLEYIKINKNAFKLLVIPRYKDIKIDHFFILSCMHSQSTNKPNTIIEFLPILKATLKDIKKYMQDLHDLDMIERDQTLTNKGIISVVGGSKYTINQQAFMKISHTSNIKISLVHAILLDYIYKQILYITQSITSQDKIKIIQDQAYVRIDYQDIIRDLTHIKIKHKRTLTKYINDLVNCDMVYLSKKKDQYYLRITDQGLKSIF